MGPFHGLSQILISNLTAEGADVAVVGPAADQAQKFLAAINDQREVRPQAGRAFAVSSELKNWSQVHDALGRAVQGFGGIDVLVDFQYATQLSPVQTEAKEFDVDALFNDQLRTTIMMSQAVTGFLRTRKKGRILYVLDSAAMEGKPELAWQGLLRGGLSSFAKALARELAPFQGTANVLAVGPTEDHLTHWIPQTPAKVALEKWAQTHPGTRILEPSKFADTVLFLLSSAGASVSGQTIRCE